MSEFTKLGGYLIEGQPEVAHDNTLSGNGLEGSPLGLSEQVSEVNDLVHSNSGTWNGVSAKLDTIAFSDVSGTFLTAHQDLSDYQTTAGMTAYLTTGDSAEFMTTAERSDYIPTGVSSEFYTTANTANYISEVPDTYLQNTDLSTEDGKVTAISGIPLSAGGDVPEGVMVESGLEYNAVNEISAYNGSAIAQYGAEKQWLVHDDTLVHAANSAQYALGVNLSALQRLMGIDETVLYDGFLSGAGSTAQLSESIKNFTKVKIYGKTDDGGLGTGTNYPVYTEAYTYPDKLEVGIATTNNGWSKFLFMSLSGDKVTNVTGRVLTWGSTTWGSLTNWAIQKVVGIGRKEV